jgi:dTDP-4-dehydrorhamnose reductase
MRVVVTGAAGQLGREITTSWVDDDVVATTRAELDVTDRDASRRLIGELAPELVVNCAAWTDVDGCQRDPDRALRVNALGAANIAAAAAAVGARVVHVSTDFVHGGDPPTGEDGRPRGWREDDPIAPVNVYGESKARGEELVLAACDDAVVVRTAWVCGRYGANFVRTMLRLGRRGADLVVVDDQFGSPTFTIDLATALHEIATATDVTGVVNRTNSGYCSWYDLAVAALAADGTGVTVGRQPSTALDRAAARPSWSVLDGSRARALGLTPLPPWEDSLRELVDAYAGVDLDAAP